MDKPLTVKELLKICAKEIQAGRGDHTIMLSNDDEGNGYHYCWFHFTPAEELDCEQDVDTDIAPISKTIILG